MQLNYKVFGEGDPLIILHGLFGTLDNWQGIAKKLAQDFMVFIVDLRNHGRSPHADDFGYALMAEDVREFMETNWIYHAYVLGHSMGGKVAMQLATDHSDLVDKLIVADIAPKTYAGSHETIFKAMFALDLPHLESRRAADEVFQQYLDSYSIRQFLLKNLYLDREAKQYRWRMNLPVIYDHYQEILAQNELLVPYEGPTLFLKGANSDYIDPQELPHYQTFFPGAQLTTIQEAGHWVHAEQPVEFVDEVRTFLLQS